MCDECIALRAEVEFTKSRFDTECHVSANWKARADAAEAEVALVTKRHNECHDEIERQQARADALMQIIEAAPHGIGCAFCAWTEKGSARIAGPCDCWKAKAEVGK